jgi:D-alanine-D-alanine ligase-like ATP-grasp enzyme
VVLDGKVISAYERLPLTVTGNGKSSIGQLFASLKRKFVREERGTSIRENDFRILNRLGHSKLSLRSVPKSGEKVVLLDNANLSSGGEAVDVTRSMHPGFKRLAINLTRDMGLRYCGVDLLVEGSLTEKPEEFWVLETNAAPGLDHYAKIGPVQAKTVRELYLKVLLAMKRPGSKG